MVRPERPGQKAGVVEGQKVHMDRILAQGGLGEGIGGTQAMNQTGTPTSATAGHNGDSDPCPARPTFSYYQALDRPDLALAAL